MKEDCGNITNFSRMRCGYFQPLLCLAISIIGVVPLLAQQPAYLHYGVSDGLPSALVYDVKQDSKGFIWLGTDKGLVRFDGTRFKVFTTKHGLPDNDVLGIHEDKQGRLWLSCFQNNPCFLKDGKIHNEENDSLLSKMDLKGGVFNFSNSDNGDLWITGDIDKYCQISKGYQLETYLSPVEAFNSVTKDHLKRPIVTVEKVESFGDRNFALGQRSILDITNQDSICPIYLFEEYEFRDEMISVVKHGNNLYVSSKKGIHWLKFNGVTFVKHKYSTKFGSSLLKVDQAGNLWCCSQRYGAVRLGVDGPDEVFLKGKKVTNMHEDREGNLWFSTLNEGVYMLPRNASLRYSIEDGLPFQSNNFVSITIATNGGVLAGDDSGNLYHYRGNIWKKYNYGSYDGYNRVQKILTFPKGQWLALTEEGFLTNIKGTFNQLNYHGAPKSACFSKGNLWVGTSGYLLFAEKLDSDNFQRVRQSRTTAICADSDSLIWVGGLNGIFCQQDHFEKNWGEAFEPLGHRITDIKSGGKNILWVASAENGLLKVGTSAGGVASVETINDHLEKPIENVQNIFPHQDGVWLSTNTGVYYLNKDYQVRHLNENNGLIGNNVNSVAVSGDTLWVATTAGISRLLMGGNDDLGNTQTFIAEMRYNIGKEKKVVDFFELQQIGKHIELPALATMAEIDLAAIHFRTRGNLQFEVSTKIGILPLYLLTWRNLYESAKSLFGNCYQITENSASHSFGITMPPGSYFCTVTAILPNGLRRASPDLITILAKPHWWQLIWFHLGLAMGVGFLFWRFFKERENFLRIQTKNTELQLQAIRSQMNPHFVGNSINAIQQFFYPPDPVKASGYISMFSDLLRRTMYFSETDFINFKDELSYIRDYLEMIKLRFGERFDYEIRGVDKLSEETPFPAMFLQPILENATLHGLAPNGKSQLDINFDLKHGEVLCQVTDNGVGITASKAMKERRAEKRVSKGLLLLEQKAKTLNSLYPTEIQFKIEDISKQGIGTGTRASISFRRLANLPKGANSDGQL